MNTAGPTNASGQMGSPGEGSAGDSPPLDPDLAARAGRHPATRVIALVLGGLLTLGLIGAGSLIGVNLMVWSSDESSELIAEPVDRVTLEVDGSITIEEATDDQVRVRRQSNYGFKKPKVSIATAGGVLSVSAQCDRAAVSICSNHLVLSVPTDTDVKIEASHDVDITGMSGRTDIRVSTGDITLRDMTGSIDAEAATGTIGAVGLESEPTTLRSFGGLRAEFDRPPDDLLVNASTGRIDVRVPRETAYLVDAVSDADVTRIDVATDPASSHRIVARADLGAVDITYIG